MNGHFDIGGISPARYFFSIAFVLGLLFAMISLDQERPAVLVFLQWQIQAMVPMALMIASHMLLLNSSGFRRLNAWLTLAISGLLGASLFVPIALSVDLWLELQAPDDLGSELLDEWFGVVPPVILCWLALNAPWQLGYRLERSQASEAAVKTETGTEAAGFMALLPPDKRGRLIMLKSELHYLQVVTENGSGLVLYNLGDAVDELPPSAGMSVHRSYWVALGAIDSFSRRGRQGEIRLSNGETVPVSRNRLAEVERLVHAHQV